MARPSRLAPCTNGIQFPLLLTALEEENCESTRFNLAPLGYPD